MPVNVAIAIAAVVVSAASAAYSAYSQQEAAAEQEDAMKKQQAQNVEAAAIQEQNLRVQGQKTAATARANAAASGILLDDAGSSAEVIQKQIKSDTDRNVGLTWKQTGWNNENIQSQIDALPSMGEIVAKSSLQFAGSALNAYSGFKSMRAQESMLASRPIGTTSNWITGGTGQSFNTNIGTKTGSYSLLG